MIEVRRRRGHRGGIVCGVLLALIGLSAWAVSLRPRDWTKYGSGGFAQASDGGLAITLPSWPSSLGYAWTTAPGALSGTLVVSGRIEVTGAPIFRWDTDPNNTCWGTPASLRPFVGQWLSKGRKHIAFADRWWAKDPYRVILGAGSFSIAVPIDRVFWTGITPLADEDLGTFPTVMASPSIIGLSFGGGCFYGHGVGVEGGTARVVVTSYQVQ